MGDISAAPWPAEAEASAEIGVGRGRGDFSSTPLACGGVKTR